MNNLVTRYILEILPVQKIKFFKDPIKEISDYHLGKIVFTGTNFGNLSQNNKGEIYSALLGELSPINENEIKVISLEQGEGTNDPKSILYTFHITTYTVVSNDNPDTHIELNPAGISKEIKQIGEKAVTKLPVKNHLNQDFQSLQERVAILINKIQGSLK